jgi:hypothetical protein
VLTACLSVCVCCVPPLHLSRGVSCLSHTAAGRGVVLSSGPDGQAVSLDARSGKKLGQFKGSKHGASAAALSAGVCRHTHDRRLHFCYMHHRLRVIHVNDLCQVR